ncbi:MAG: TraC family protein [Candidatus Magasanikbacteria bacterium]|nr:TraC family protein [Candidatus Magasanikbacteria bacterium]
MVKNKKSKKSKKPASQSYLPIAQIKDGVVVLKDGTMRSVLLVSSINFALKSEDEQNALISSYASFLNSLEYPLQVVIQSRKLQIQPYIENLLKMQKEQTNELLKAQIGDYGSFISELVDIGEIMSKRFYVVVPYDPLSNKKKSFWSRFQEAVKPVTSIRLKGERFDKRKEDLSSRVRQVVSGLGSMGLQVAELDTQALVELYYSTYNPDIAYAQQLQDINKIQVEQI